MKQTLSYFWKLLLCSLGFFFGLALNYTVLNVLGYQPSKMLNGAFANISIMWLLVGSMLSAFILSFVSRILKVNWLLRWIILLELFWLFGIGGISAIFSLSVSMSVVASLLLSLIVMSNFILPGLLLSGLVTILFRHTQSIKSHSQNQVFASQAVYSIDI